MAATMTDEPEFNVYPYGFWYISNINNVYIPAVSSVQNLN